MDNFLQKFGFKSRTLTLMLHSTDFSTGRTALYSKTLKAISEKPFLGYGLAGDRVILGGTYPHNFFLEVIAQFGVIFGFLFSVLIIVLCIVGFFANKPVVRDLTAIFFSIGFIHLLLSGSYLTSANFWLLIAIGFDSICLHKRKQVSDNICS